MDLPPYLADTPEGAVLRVRVQPRASRTEFAGRHGDLVRLRVQAPPVEGAANEACTRFLAKFFGLARSRVRLRAGARGREKAFLLAGLSAAEVRRRLPES
ncbi:DUF167 domain-containing protein [Dissulfurirhabdus thermomarina]|uniref:UPF0235 protein G3N55_08115 n=1 Tax=Dissulfurirhabdus thermomarina TaxID=1765737 RepID=A0A6N9TWE6_DISTH|nr:DUF167 domain-containing protein [Dissulfurirhabdus thermomarina]NDY42806.1 DUF167 domain-containing protein [Dissulfurirhabdus thermomarina]NMX24386.1 DUF167 domain-containing protein [Dissulfurirhabdus thermomarina]